MNATEFSKWSVAERRKFSCGVKRAAPLYITKAERFAYHQPKGLYIINSEEIVYHHGADVHMIRSLSAIWNHGVAVYVIITE